MKPKICYQLSTLSLFIMLFISCAVQLPAPRKTATYLDFTKYPDFYISQSQTLDQKYTPLGLVTGSAISGYDKNSKETGQSFYDAISDQAKRFVPMTSEDAVNLIYEKAKTMGANGIIGIKIDYIPSGATFLTYGFSASGMAIKIIEK